MSDTTTSVSLHRDDCTDSATLSIKGSWSGHLHPSNGSISVKKDACNRGFAVVFEAAQDCAILEDIEYGHLKDFHTKLGLLLAAHEERENK